MENRPSTYIEPPSIGPRRPTPSNHADSLTGNKKFSSREWFFGKNTSVYYGAGMKRLATMAEKRC